MRCMVNSEGALVVRKLCSTLVAYFIQFSTSWSNCVKHIMYCMCVNEALPYDQLSAAPETSLLIQNVSNEKAVAIFWFAATLVDEIGKMDSNNMKQFSFTHLAWVVSTCWHPSRHKFHRLIKPNVEDIAPLIARYISDDAADVNVREEALKCFQVHPNAQFRVYYANLIVMCLLFASCIRWWWDHSRTTPQIDTVGFRRLSR